MAHDVFISYSKLDKPIADAVCAVLEAAHIRCWVAPRDILPSADWGESIVNAIASARAMVLIFSSRANSSIQVTREVERAVHNTIPIIPLRIEDVLPTKSLEYFLSMPHWLDAYTVPLENHLRELVDVLRRVLDIQLEKTTAIPTALKETPKHVRLAPWYKLGVTFGIAGIVLVLGVLAADYIIHPRTEAPVISAVDHDSGLGKAGGSDSSSSDVAHGVLAPIVAPNQSASLAVASAKSQLPLTPAQSVRPLALGTPLGSWHGQYVCAQGLTGVDITIADGGGGGAVSGSFHFYNLPGHFNAADGAYYFQGSFDAATGLLSVEPTNWQAGQRVASYKMCGFNASLTNGGAQLIGKIDNPTCGMIKLIRATVGGTESGNFSGTSTK